MVRMRVDADQGNAGPGLEGMRCRPVACGGRRAGRGLAAGFLAALLAAGLAAAGDGPPDPSEGVIGGKVALMVWPFADGQPLTAEGFQLHLVGRSHPGEEKVVPVGRWQQPPADVYRFWLEGPGVISPDNDTPLQWKNVPPPPGQHKGLLVAGEVVDSGAVELATNWKGGRGTFRLLTIPQTVKTPAAYARPVGLFSRRVPMSGGTARTVLPQGRGVAALYDEENGTYVGIAGPFDVRSGRTAEVAVEPPPEGRAQLLVHVPYAGLADAGACRKELSAVWRGPLGGVRPDAVACGTRRAWLFWFSLRPGAGVLSVGTDGAVYRTGRMEIREREASFVEAVLQERPSLDVTWDLPPELLDGQQEVKIVLREDTGGAKVRTSVVSQPVGELSWKGLDPGRFVVDLVAGPWRYRHEVDLVCGFPRSVTFRPDVFHISGTVYVGKDPRPATIYFGTGEERVAPVKTDEDGHYETVLFHGGFYMIRVVARGYPDRGYVIMLDEPIESDRELDFHLPWNRYVVQTVDAKGGAVPRVDLSVFTKTPEGKTQSYPMSTGEDGSVELPPIDPGEMTVTVTDPRFERSAVTRTVPEDAGEQEIRLVVRKKDDEGIRLTVTLPGGGAAAGARVLALAPSPPGAVLWQGETDAAGACILPRKLAGRTLVIFHPHAGMTVAPVSDPGGEGLALRLNPPAPSLALDVMLAGGRPLPQQFLRLLVVQGGVRLPSFILQGLGLLSPTPSGTQWVLSGLAAAPVSLLAWKADPGLDRAGMTGGLDGRAVTVMPGSVQVVHLEAVEP